MFDVKIISRDNPHEKRLEWNNSKSEGHFTVCQKEFLRWNEEKRAVVLLSKKCMHVEKCHKQFFLTKNLTFKKGARESGCKCQIAGFVK